MLRRMGLPEIHARFAPWFLKSNAIELGRWSSVLFARLERAFYARPEELSTLEALMREHQRQYNVIMKPTAQSAGSEAQHPRQMHEPSQQNQLMLQRAFRDCSFHDDGQNPRKVSPIQVMPDPLGDRKVDSDSDEEENALERTLATRIIPIPEVAALNAPPGLAPAVRGQLESHGKHKFVSYNGRWKEGRMHGPLGVYTFADGGKYRGEWVDSQPHGSGIASYPNGVTYTGAFVHGQFHGFGMQEMRLAGSRLYRYEGQFEHGQRCGQGKLTLVSSESCYEGEFYLNQRHGKGTERNALGYAYTGLWSRNRMCGPGKLTMPDKKTEVFKQSWPMCLLGEAIRLVKEEQQTKAWQQELWFRQLLRVRDDLRALDQQYAFWEAEEERLERDEDERVGKLKQARRDKRDAVAAAKRAFLDRLQASDDEDDSGEADEEEADNQEEEQTDDEQDDAEEEQADEDADSNE